MAHVYIFTGQNVKKSEFLYLVYYLDEPTQNGHNDVVVRPS